MKDNKIVLPPDAKGGVSITPPQGCEVDKVEVIDGVLAVTFKPKERKLPKTWEEFCEINDVSDKEFYIDDYGVICNAFDYKSVTSRHQEDDKNLLQNRATAEAILALCQLIQLRNAYNGDWVPDWKDYEQDKFTIEFHDSKIFCDCTSTLSALLYFRTDELRDEFLANFRPLIEKLKPLYGIKEGGEE